MRMIVPAMMESHAAQFAERAAPFAFRAPRRLPTRAEVATPMPNGMVFITWSDVMITDCAAREMVPRRPAARATISKAHHSVPTWITPSKARRAKVERFWREARFQPPQQWEVER